MTCGVAAVQRHARSDPEATFSYAVEQLNRFGFAYLHVTEMGKDAPGAAGPAFDLIKLRRIWKGVYMTNGGYGPAHANAALAKGAPLNTPDQAMFYGGNAKGCTDYPFLDMR